MLGAMRRKLKRIRLGLVTYLQGVQMVGVFCGVVPEG
jgi:hypothetical protein